jgi:4-hydroxy-tetrahydrodipicolinate synthase
MQERTVSFSRHKLAWRYDFMENVFFTGTCTALVTPFIGNQVNYPMLERLLQRQIEAGIPAVVLGGTTGEAPTLTDQEKIELFRRSKLFVGERLKIICGTGGNNTAHAMALSKAAQDAGADGLLVVAPYYNKGNFSGQIDHYISVARSVEIPIILYNVPGRTGVDLSVMLYRQLCDIPNIIGVKEACTDIVKTARIRTACGPEFTVWSGNDDMAVAAMALGAQGVISVLSNLLPEQTLAMSQAALAGDFDTAADLQCRLLPLIEVLFREVNPIPVKAAMQMIGFDCGPCRLPLGPISRDTEQLLKQLLQ